MDHPDISRLRAFLRDQATPLEVEHIESCAQCAAEIQRLGQEETPFDNGMLQEAQAMKSFERKVEDTVVFPTHFGAYRVLRCLFQTNLSWVFLAVDPEGFHVVVKMPRGPSRTNGRPQREIAFQLQYQSPHFTRLIDRGVADDIEYFVMEFIDGLTFQELVEAHGPLPIPVACRLIQEAAVGLDALHRFKHVHRDVKPANLMLARTGQVKLLDFGLVLPPDIPGGLPMTEANIGFGTPDYMPPEQWTDVHKVDVRADLYALGGVLYFLLAGQAPFEQARTKMQAHLNEKPGEIARTDIPAALRQILIDKLLAKNREQRIPAARDLMDALEPFAQRVDLADWLQNPQAPLPVGVEPQPTPAPVDLAPSSRPVFSVPLQAKLDLLFWDAQRRRMRSVAEPGVLPAAAGSQFQIDVRLNRPAHVYLLWINPEGVVAPVYPWKPVSAWEWEHPDEPLQGGLVLPRPVGTQYATWPLTGSAGVETVVLLARDEPLSQGERTKLPHWTARIGTMPKLADPSSAAWFGFNGTEPAKLKGFHPTPQINTDPLFQIDSLLRDRLGQRFDLIQSVSFTNRGTGQ